MRKLSWVLLAFLGVVMLAISLLSTRLAYTGDYPIGGTPIAEVTQGNEELNAALRGVRGTSAAYAAAYAVLFLTIAVVPYRRGDVWSWWALLASLVLLAGIVSLRLPMLGYWPGAVTSWISLGVGTVALLCDVKRLRSV